MPEGLARGRIAFAVVRSDPPVVFVAENDLLLDRVLALQLVAQLPANEVSSPERLQAMRKALLDERWADALLEWINETDTAVDAYPDEEIWRNTRLDGDQAVLEIRVAPIFTD